MSSEATSERTEFISAEIAVTLTRVLVAGLLWWIAVNIVDHERFRSTDPYVANMRLGFWLFFAEILVSAYYVRYSAPCSYPIGKRTAFITPLRVSMAASRSASSFRHPQKG